MSNLHPVFEQILAQVNPNKELEYLKRQEYLFDQMILAETHDDGFHPKKHINPRAWRNEEYREFHESRDDMGERYNEGTGRRWAR